MARVKWHLGDGPTYCSGCARDNLPCASGRPGQDGHICPYQEHEPKTIEGWETWAVVEALAPMTLTSKRFPIETAFEIARCRGYNMAAASLFLPVAAAAAGICTER